MNISFVQFERGFDAFADYLWETKNQGKLWKVCFEADSQIWLFFYFCGWVMLGLQDIRHKYENKEEEEE